MSPPPRPVVATATPPPAVEEEVVAAVVVVDEEEAEGGLTTRVGGLAGELERGWASSSPKPPDFSTDSLAEEEDVEVVAVAQGVADLVDIQEAIPLDIQVVTQVAILQEELPL